MRSGMAHTMREVRLSRTISPSWQQNNNSEAREAGTERAIGYAKPMRSRFRDVRCFVRAFCSANSKSGRPGSRGGSKDERLAKPLILGFAPKHPPALF